PSDRLLHRLVHRAVIVRPVEGTATAGRGPSCAKAERRPETIVWIARRISFARFQSLAARRMAAASLARRGTIIETRLGPGRTVWTFGIPHRLMRFPRNFFVDDFGDLRPLVGRQVQRRDDFEMPEGPWTLLLQGDLLQPLHLPGVEQCGQFRRFSRTRRARVRGLAPHDSGPTHRAPRTALRPQSGTRRAARAKPGTGPRALFSGHRTRVQRPATLAQQSGGAARARDPASRRLVLFAVRLPRSVGAAAFRRFIIR